MRLSAALCLLLAGCVVHEDYLVEMPRVDHVDHVDQVDPDYPVPATRVRDGRKTFVRFRTIDAPIASSEATDGKPVLVHTAAPSKRIAAGSALTWIGTALSLAGTVGFFVAPASDTDLRVASGVVAGSAEPVMIAGTLLWIFGALHPPQEIR